LPYRGNSKDLHVARAAALNFLAQLLAIDTPVTLMVLGGAMTDFLSPAGHGAG